MTTSADDAAGGVPSAGADDTAPGAISDDQLPEDLRPSEDNPLARNPDEEGDEVAPGSGRQSDDGVDPVSAAPGS